MRFEILTLFPELFDALHVGLLGKAIESSCAARLVTCLSENA